MQSIFLDKRGFTTAELLVAALFGMIVMATLYGFFREQMFNLLSQETKTATLEDARGALDIMVRELRNAGAFPVTTGVSCVKDASNNPKRVVAASASSIQIQSDTDGNGNCTGTGESVTYTFTGSTITRNVSTSPLVSNPVVPASGSDYLTYYQAGSTTPLTHPISDLTSIKRIKITFAIQVENPNPSARSANPYVSSTLSSSVEFRN